MVLFDQLNGPPLPPLSPAVWTNPRELQLITDDLVPARRIESTTVYRIGWSIEDIADAAAPDAPDVVVRADVAIKPSLSSSRIYPVDCAGLSQLIKIPVHGTQADAGHELPDNLEQFGSRGVGIELPELFHDHLALAGLSLGGSDFNGPLKYY